MAESDNAAGYQLEFDPKRKYYATRNRKYIIRPQLDLNLKKEDLSASELATTRFVLKTDHPAMYVLSVSSIKSEHPCFKEQASITLPPRDNGVDDCRMTSMTL